MPSGRVLNVVCGIVIWTQRTERLCFAVDPRVGASGWRTACGVCGLGEEAAAGISHIDDLGWARNDRSGGCRCQRD